MQSQLKIRRIALNAVLIAVYVVLSGLTIQISGLKITFEHFPVVLCAVIFGPFDAMIVGGVGEFFNQMTTFGFTPTTLLWVLPIVFRGASIGFLTNMMSKQISIDVVIQKKVPIMFGLVCIVSGICSSLLNTVALYVDSKMLGYYSFALVFGALAMRMLLSVITSICIVLAIKPILRALRISKLI